MARGVIQFCSTEGVLPAILRNSTIYPVQIVLQPAQGAASKKVVKSGTGVVAFKFPQHNA